MLILELVRVFGAQAPLQKATLMTEPLVNSALAQYYIWKPCWPRDGLLKAVFEY